VLFGFVFIEKNTINKKKNCCAQKYLFQPGQISLLGYMQVTLTWTLKAVPHSAYIISIFSDFFAIFD
jgi:hypothetical protein